MSAQLCLYVCVDRYELGADRGTHGSQELRHVQTLQAPVSKRPEKASGALGTLIKADFATCLQLFPRNTTFLFAFLRVASLTFFRIKNIDKNVGSLNR